MESCLQQALKNFVRKFDRLKNTLKDFIEEQTQLVSEINEVQVKSECGSKLANTVSHHCESVLLHADDMVDRLNLLLQCQLPKKSKLRDFPTQEFEPVAPKEQLTQHIPLSKFLICTITCVLDAEELIFYACDNKNPIMAEIIKLQETPASLPTITKLPDAQQIVGYYFEQRLCRASFDAKRLEITLIDLGEKIRLDLMQPFKFYELPSDLQKIPKQAMKCKLLGVMGKQLNEKELQNLLIQSLQQKTALLVESIEAELLNVLMIKQEHHKTEHVSISEKVEKVEPVETVKKEEEVIEEKTAAESTELEDLYDEPLGTTNALKAVLGYIPKDESRLCQFYDAKTGGCFKGARCKLEHAAPSSDAFTSDVVPASAYNYEPVEIIYEAEQIINITVTYVNELFGFYAKINDFPNEPLEQFIWEDNLISSSLRFQRGDQVPKLFDLVLARTPLSHWYRAQVRAEVVPGEVFEVYYVDYGNRDVVELRNLARCTQAALISPFQAQFILLADVEACKVSHSEHLRGVNMLRNALLYKTFDVRVVRHELDLFVELMGDKAAVVGRLCEEQLLRRVNTN